MSVTFSVPSTTSPSVTAIDSFRGVDFTSNPGNVDPRMSPDAPNMIRDVPGKVRKCMGYHTVVTYDGRINGYHVRRGDDEGIVHAGTKAYKGETLMYEGMNDQRSKSWQFDDKLYLMDGKKLLVYDGSTMSAVEGKIPVITIAKAPSGGGTTYYDLNLIQPKFTEQFAGTANTKDYHLTFGDLDATTVTAQVMDASGNWADKTEGADFSVNRTTGVITFVNAPGVSPVTGEDNVKITAARTVEGYADRINKCAFGILFGVNGAADRIFAAGNPDHINWDWYCDQNDPTYWPDTAYSVMGTEGSAIVGYSIVNNYLACHKDSMEDGRNVIIRQGNLVDNEPAFPIYNTLQGPGAVATWSFGYISNEPMFLTDLGIYSITASDITGEKYSQSRGYYVKEKLAAEPNQEDTFGFVFKDLYWLCLNGVAYILDGMQRMASDSTSDPYSTRQYAGFYRTNLPARVMWEQDGVLCFGGNDGKVRHFYTEPNDPTSYNDDGEAIRAWWTTPYLFGGNFMRNKTFRNLALLLSSAVQTSVVIQTGKKGVWATTKEESAKTRYFDWNYFMWSKFTWNCDPTPRLVVNRSRLKKVEKAQYRFMNTEKNEGFGILQFAVEYKTGAIHKG